MEKVLLIKKNERCDDGKDLGEIKVVSENYLHVEKGTLHQNMLQMLLPARHYGF
jgi:hypothetical protein